MNTSIRIVAVTMIASLALQAESKVKLESLPQAVQTTIRNETRGGTLLAIVKEVENGKTLYEVESKKAGKTRDFMVDTSGSVVSVEEETDMASVPQEVQAGLKKAAGSSKITKVEKVTEGTVTKYEATVQGKLGKKSEVSVNADGSPIKQEGKQ